MWPTTWTPCASSPMPQDTATLPNTTVNAAGTLGAHTFRPVRIPMAPIPRQRQSVGGRASSMMWPNTTCTWLLRSHATPAKCGN